MRSDPRFDRLMDLLFVGDIGAEAVDLFRDRIGWRREFEIDHRDLIDNVMLEKCFDEREILLQGSFGSIKTDKRLNALRDDPRFQKLVARFDSGNL